MTVLSAEVAAIDHSHKVSIPSDSKITNIQVDSFQNTLRRSMGNESSQASLRLQMKRVINNHAILLQPIYFKCDVAFL